MVHEIGRRQDEHLAHHVRILLIAAHEADHATAGRTLDDRFEARAHQLLKRDPLLDHRSATAAFRATSPRRA